MLTVVDCNGLSGALSYGMVEAGAKLLARTGYLELGRHIVRANSSMWGGDHWADAIDKKSPDLWERWWLEEKADVIVAVPPCSGFSLLTGKGGSRGSGGNVNAHAGHPMNDCMWSSARYAGRHAPQAFMFESVTGAFRQGRDLMKALRDEVEKISGETYTLTHWLHDTVTMGAPTSRQRYMFVIVKGDQPLRVVPVEEYAVSDVTPMSDAVGDLAKQPLMIGEQKLKSPRSAGPYGQSLQREDGYVDGHWNDHFAKESTGRRIGSWEREYKEMFAALEAAGLEWHQGEATNSIMARITEAHGPEIMTQVFGPTRGPRLLQNGFNTGAYGSRRETWDSYCTVIAGDGGSGHIHPIHDRQLTLRECARIQGWPDELRIDFDTTKFGKEKLIAVWGKAVTVPAAKHASQALSDHLAGKTAGDGYTQGEAIGEREWLIDDLAESRRLRRQHQMIKKGLHVRTGV